MRHTQALAAVILLFSSCLFTAVASADDWTLLGNREVIGHNEDNKDNDRTEETEATDRTAVGVIHVDVEEGRFSRLRLDVDNVPVEFQRVHITFDNETDTSTDTDTSISTGIDTGTGTDTEIIPGQTFNRDFFVGKRGMDVVFDLKDAPRKIKNVMLVYEAHSPDFETAIVELFGQ